MNHLFFSKQKNMKHTLKHQFKKYQFLKHKIMKRDFF